MRYAITVSLVAAAGLLSSQNPAAQETNVHLNPVVAKLAAGTVVYGLANAGDFSLANARETARAPVDFVYADLEHNALDLPGLADYVLRLSDRAAILAKGNLQPNVALFARFPPETDQALWVVKQALDIGLMGVIFNGIASREQALTAVRMMRYPPMRGSARPEPIGIRGYGPAAASWAWGVSIPEYERRADVWPLNPDGDLLAIMMIESVEGVKQVDAIATVPGVGALFVAGRQDLSRSIGVPLNSPEVETAVQQVLTACKSHKVACAITELFASDVVRRVKEEWNIIRSTVPSIVEARKVLG